MVNEEGGMVMIILLLIGITLGLALSMLIIMIIQKMLEKEKTQLVLREITARDMYKGMDKDDE